MASNQRKLDFAKRFNDALEHGNKAGLSGEELVKLLAREGVSVTAQTVSNWRNGTHMPKLEQLEGLAAMLRTDAGVLAFGGSRIAQARQHWPMDQEERDFMDRFALLGEAERSVVAELVRLLQLGRATGGKRPGRPRRQKDSDA